MKIPAIRWIGVACGALVLAAPVACRRDPGGESPKSQTAQPTPDHTENHVINPPALTQPPPADRTRIADNETLYACVKGSPNTLNPIFMSSVPDKRCDELLFSRPITFDANLGWVATPHVVENVTFQDDHRSATLTLRQGLKWHDGQPMTADDIAFTWRQIIDPRVPCASAKSGVEQIESCGVIDKRSVRYTFKSAAPTNKWSIQFPVIPKHIYEVQKEADPSLSTNDYYVRKNRAPIGNGPYRFVAWIADNQVVFDRWEDFPGPKPFFKRIVLRIIPDASTRLLMFEKQEIDETELLPEQFLQCADDERFAEVGVLGYKSKWSFNYIAWNMDGSNPFFADRRVRRAMSYAIDYDRIRQQVYHGLYAQSLGVFHPDSPAGNPNIEPYTFHLDRAQALLDDAGWHRDAEDGWRYKEVPTDGGVERRRFSFSLLVPTASSSGPNFAAIYQEDLARIGVEMTPRMIEWSAFLEMIRKHDFEAQLSSFGTAVDPDYAWNVFHSESSEHGRNYMSYANPDVDRLFAAGRAEFDNDRRMTIYRELAKTLYDDAAVTCIVDVPTLWAFNKRLRGVTFSPRGPNLFSPGVLNWWVQKGMGLHDAPSP